MILRAGDAGDPLDEEAGRIESAAVGYARAMGEVAMARYLSPVEVEYKQKGSRDPVSEVDRYVEEYIRTSVSRDFPGHNVMGEEQKLESTSPSPFLWVVDPVDGTANFLSGYPFFAVSIGVLHEREPIAAAVFLSTCHRGGPGIYHARRHGGARLDGEPVTIWPIGELAPTKVAGLPGSFAAAFSARRAFHRTAGEVRLTGSIAAELCLTAAGSLQYAIFGAPKIWDVAAGALLVAEAGGAVLVWDHQSRDWTSFQSFQPALPAEATVAEPLRRWSQPMIAANSELARSLASQIRPRGRTSRRIVEMLMRLFI